MRKVEDFKIWEKKVQKKTKIYKVKEDGKKLKYPKINKNPIKH